MNYNFTTSGTTGHAKEFRLTKKQLEARVNGLLRCRPPGWEKVRSIYSAFPHDRPSVNVRWVMRNGGSVYRTIEQIYAHQPDVIMGLPEQLVKIAHAINNLYHPMFVWSTSALMTPEQCIAVRAGLGDNVWSSYNTSETGTISLADAEQIESIGGCVGKPVEGAEIKIVDGEVWVKASTMIERYVDSPLLSMQFFRGGWFITSDFGNLTPDGLLVLRGRK